MEEWSNRLCRLKFDGRHSLRDRNGLAYPGDLVASSVYLPVDDGVHYRMQEKKLVSAQKSKKVYAVRVDFGSNTDSLEYIQIAIPLGNEGARETDALKFHGILARALSVGINDELEEKGSEDETF